MFQNRREVIAFSDNKKRQTQKCPNEMRGKNHKQLRKLRFSNAYENLRGKRGRLSETQFFKGVLLSGNKEKLQIKANSLSCGQQLNYALNRQKTN